MPLYTYVCDECGASCTKLRAIDERDEPVHCAGGGATGAEQGHIGVGPTMRRTLEMPAIHYKGYGWTRTPAILNDPIAAGVNAQQRSNRINWGTQDGSAFGEGLSD